jgi:hypothetical protein
LSRHGLDVEVNVKKTDEKARRNGEGETAERCVKISVSIPQCHPPCSGWLLRLGWLCRMLIADC